MQDAKLVSPYLRRPLRSLKDVLRQRHDRLARRRWVARDLPADNGNGPPPSLAPRKSA